VDFLEIRGKQLTKINFISVKEINFKAIALLSVHCPSVSQIQILSQVQTRQCQVWVKKEKPVENKIKNLLMKSLPIYIFNP
jgi:hypothetical protein